MRAIHAAEAIAAEPTWMTPFLASLARADLAPATLRGYRYDLRHFLAWHRTVQDSVFAVEGDVSGGHGHDPAADGEGLLCRRGACGGSSALTATDQ